MFYGGEVPVHCPYFITGNSGGLDTVYLPFSGYPGGCHARGRPETRRPNPVHCPQFFPVDPSVMNDALALAGGLIEGLLGGGQMPRNTRCCHQPTDTQQKQADKKVPSDVSQAQETTPQGTAEDATKDCPCQQSVNACCQQSAADKCPGKREETTPKDETRNGTSEDTPASVWLQPVNLPGFAPDEVKVRVSDAGVHIHAKAEKSSGPGPCLSRYEMMRTVKIPADVDQKSVSCVMTPNGTLLIYARKMTSALEEKAEKPEAVTQQPEGEKEELQKETTESKQKEEQEEKNTETEHNEEAEAKNADSMHAEETCAEEKCVAEEQQESTQCEGTSLSQADTHPAEDAPEPESPKSLADIAAEALKMDEKDDELDPTEDSEENVERGITEEVPDPYVELPEEEEETCLMQCIEAENVDCGELDFEVIEAECVTEMTTVDTDGELSEHEENKTTNADGEPGEPGEPATGEAAEPTEQESKQGTDSTETDTPVGNTVPNTPPADTDPTPPIKRFEAAKEADRKVSEESKDLGQSAASVNQPPSFKDAEPFCTLVPLAGFHPEDLHIELKEQSLLVTAEREGSYGGMGFTDRMHRRLDLPEHVDTTTVRCVYRPDGMLVVTALPKYDDTEVPVKQSQN